MTTDQNPPISLCGQQQRLDALAGFDAVGASLQADFDDLVRLAAETFGAEMAVVNLVADDRQWFVAERGIGVQELPLDVSICAYTVAQDDFLAIPDLRQDARFAANPLVTSDDGLRFYAGAILRSTDGFPIGTVCVLDRSPRPGGVTPHQRLVLEVLAKQVMTQLELRRALVQQKSRADELAQAIITRDQATDALDESRTGYRLATRVTNDAIWDWDLTSDHVRWNEALCDRYGHAVASVVPTGEWWIGHIHPDDRGRIDHSIHVAIDSRADRWEDRYRFRRADGSYASILDRGNIVRDGEGRAIRMIGAMLDMSEHEENRALLEVSEERRRDSEERYSTLFKAVDVGFCVVEMRFEDGRAVDYRFEELNPAFERQTGLIGAQGRWVSDLVPGLERHWFDAYGNVALTGNAVRFENGSEPMGRWFDVHAFRTGSAGRYRVAILFNDISGRKRAEDGLRDLNETLERQVAERTAALRQYHDIVEATASPICAFDTQYRLIAFNKAHNDEFRRVNGFDSKLGDVFPDLFLAEQGDAMRSLMDRALAGERFTQIESFGRPEFGIPFWEISYTPLRDGEGRIIGAFHLANDISSRLLAERELTSAQEALRQSQKMEAMGSLTGGVAHDFNNLLTPIVGSLDMLQRKGLGSEREQRLIAGALQSAERARTLVQRLLAFARRQPLQVRAVDVGHMVKGLVDLISSTSGPQTRVLVDVADDLPAAIADQNQLEMALLNLCVNARDAMPEGGRLSIMVRAVTMGAGRVAGLAPGDYVCLSVTDTGTGMDAETLHRAIEPFYSTKGIGKGTGLGLSMVHGLAAQLGGGLVIDSLPGLGTDVQLWLPVTQERCVVEAKGERGCIPSQVGRVLLVDDEDIVRESTANMLVELGYDVREARSAEEALQLIADGLVPDLLVTDHLMPGRSGTDLAREIVRALPRTRILIVSGYAEVDGIAPEMPRLVKPFRQDELAASLIDQHRPDQPMTR